VSGQCQVSVRPVSAAFKPESSEHKAWQILQSGVPPAAVVAGDPKTWTLETKDQLGNKIDAWEAEMAALKDGIEARKAQTAAQVEELKAKAAAENKVDQKKLEAVHKTRDKHKELYDKLDREARSAKKGGASAQASARRWSGGAAAGAGLRASAAAPSSPSPPSSASSASCAPSLSEPAALPLGSAAAAGRGQAAPLHAAGASRLAARKWPPTPSVAHSATASSAASH
jgi:hypothetical protein